MKAYLIFTGTELLLGQIVNTNARYLAKELAQMGIDLYTLVTVGDNRQRIAEAISLAQGKADLIIINGGLGPTEDDITREALADALQLKLVESSEAKAVVERYFKLKGRPLDQIKKKQFLAPEGAQILDNRIGTAPGIVVTAGESTYCLLPGPSREMEIMFTEQLMPYLQAKYHLDQTIQSKVLKVVGLGEPQVEDKVKEFLPCPNPTLAPTVKLGEVHLRITAKGKDSSEVQQLIKQMEKKVRSKLDDYIYGTDEETLERVIGEILTRNQLKIATVESCTGGLLAHRLTNVAGSSMYFQMGAVTYASRWKTRLAGVGVEKLAAYGAVSPETAEAMAKGLREYTNSDLTIAITGLAGPGGGTPEKPVGLVYIAINFRGNIVIEREQFFGDRTSIKAQAAQRALVLLWELLRYE
ncbi:competence/damage-inducible protein A [Bacillota bacterium LX-D]|nr:competence/damage-inducible protein A [Bacillota bacterium LX-D]